MNTINILIAEDNQKYAKYYTDVFEHLNSLKTNENYFKAEVVSDGYEAYNRLINLDYNFVIFEEYLPNMKATEILEKLPDYKKNICSVLITRTGSENLAVKAFRLGMKNYWRKEKLGEADLEREILKCMPKNGKEDEGSAAEPAKKELSEEHSHTFFVFGIIRNPGLDNLHSRDALDAIYQTVRNMFEAKVHEYGGRIISRKANAYLASFHESYNFATMTVLCAIEVFSGICIYNLSESNNTLSRLRYKICLHKGDVKDEKNTELIISKDLNLSVHMYQANDDYNFVISQPVYDDLDEKLKKKFIQAYEFENYPMYYYKFWENIS